MANILTVEEMEKLTGAHTIKRQVEVLERSRILFVTSADGKPVTTWEAVNSVLAPSSATPSESSIKWGAVNGANA